ncbi:MAG: NAD-dependent epimerase/dehydratase family protein [Candidatus Zambryskibacteria bacterium]|nr:NAD-dependent epimerase/dehydratase family protein [Candidatus Zambryskibacteria bacterium]
MSEKIIVTGGAGFIGSNITRELVSLGFDVHVVDNLSGGKKENVDSRATLHIVDLTDLNAIKPIFKDATYVFHLAALPRVQFSIEFPAESHNANVNGTLNVLLASKEAGVKKVIYSASSSAYGDQPIMPLKEDMSPNPKSPYALQKYMGELLCKMFSQIYNLPTVSLRYFNVYGPGQSAEGAYALVIAKFLKQIKEGKTMTVTGDGSQTRDFTNVKDVVCANILAMKSEKVGNGEVLNIGAGKNQSINTITKLIGGPVEYIPARFEPKDTLADNSLARELLGWIPEVKIEEGIDELKKLYL